MAQTQSQSPTLFTVFDTRLGPCAIAWREGDATSALTHVELPAVPHEDRAAFTERFLMRLPSAREVDPTPAIAQAAGAIARHFDGALSPLDDLRVDLAATPPFHRRVYEALRRVPPGKTVTYAELATLAGSPGASRAVGQAMAKNPCPLVVPCHRVLAAGGRPGGFSAAGGAKLKAQMLEIEGVTLPSSRQLPLGETGQ